jgi:two-component system OmpR family response regulator
VALKIFLVEDNEAMRAHLVELLAQHISLELVGCAETESQASAWLDRHPAGWDVAIVDLLLREGTGAGVLRHCKQRGEFQDVLIMTNHPDSSLLTHCRLLGATAIYDKSTELDDLVAYCIGRAGRTGPSLLRRLRPS